MNKEKMIVVEKSTKWRLSVVASGSLVVGLFGGYTFGSLTQKSTNQQSTGQTSKTQQDNQDGNNMQSHGGQQPQGQGQNATSNEWSRWSRWSWRARRTAAARK